MSKNEMKRFALKIIMSVYLSDDGGEPVKELEDKNTVEEDDKDETQASDVSSPVVVS